MKKNKIKTLAVNFCLAFLLIGTISCKDTPKKDAANANTNVEQEAANENAKAQFGGLALYTVRDAMAADAKATLKAVADAGYKNIEAAGYEDGKFYNMSPEEFKNYVAEVNLHPLSSHQGSVTLENADAMMAHVKAAGFTYFVVPIPPMGHFKYDNATNTMSMTGGAKNLAP